MALPGRAALLAVVAAVAACGGGPAPPPSDGVPALPPSGPMVHEVHYTCESGRRTTLLLELPEPERLAEVLHPMDLCQYDDGLVEVRVALDCDPGQPRTEIRVRAVDGQLPVTEPLCD